jgi:hypothetical protein
MELVGEAKVLPVVIYRGKDFFFVCYPTDVNENKLEIVNRTYRSSINDITTGASVEFSFTIDKDNTNKLISISLPKALSSQLLKSSYTGEIAFIESGIDTIEFFIDISVRQSNT